jgi:hypothetical protein
MAKVILLIEDAEDTTYTDDKCIGRIKATAICLDPPREDGFATLAESVAAEVLQKLSQGEDDE